ncbi:MAG: hypothetical protein U9O59_08270, partial [Actinomycetota bacterium]|nr:hypothetical protein [Actinomycetota bacterium]
MNFKKLTIVMASLLLGVSVIFAQGLEKDEAVKKISQRLVGQLMKDMDSVAVVDFVTLDGRQNLLGKYIREELSTNLS